MTRFMAEAEPYQLSEFKDDPCASRDCARRRRRVIVHSHPSLDQRASLSRLYGMTWRLHSNTLDDVAHMLQRIKTLRDIERKSWAKTFRLGRRS